MEKSWPIVWYSLSSDHDAVIAEYIWRWTFNYQINSQPKNFQCSNLCFGCALNENHWRAMFIECQLNNSLNLRGLSRQSSIKWRNMCDVCIMHMHSRMNGKYLANFQKCDNFPLENIAKEKSVNLYDPEQWEQILFEK